jgi:hypothetical protein
MSTITTKDAENSKHQCAECGDSDDDGAKVETANVEGSDLSDEDVMIAFMTYLREEQETEAKDIFAKHGIGWKVLIERAQEFLRRKGGSGEGGLNADQPPAKFRSASDGSIPSSSTLSNAIYSANPNNRERIGNEKESRKSNVANHDISQIPPVPAPVDQTRRKLEAMVANLEAMVANLTVGNDDNLPRIPVQSPLLPPPGMSPQMSSSAPIHQRRMTATNPPPGLPQNTSTPTMMATHSSVPAPALAHVAISVPTASIDDSSEVEPITQTPGKAFISAPIKCQPRRLNNRLKDQPSRLLAIKKSLAKHQCAECGISDDGSGSLEVCTGCHLV